MIADCAAWSFFAPFFFSFCFSLAIICMTMAAMSPSEESLSSLKLIVCAQDNVSEWNGEEVSLATRIIRNAVHGGGGSQLTGAWRLRQSYRPTAQQATRSVDTVHVTTESVLNTE
jgi:hypothetical protein